MKGMVVATKTMALTVIDLLTNPDLIKKAKEELIEKHWQLPIQSIAWR
jgi:hypothetical protein